MMLTLNGFPVVEFGYLEEVVSHLNKLSTSFLCFEQVRLLKGMKSSYQITLDFSLESDGGYMV